MTVSRKRLFLIDGMSHVYRAYYAIRNLSNSKGFPTNAIYGFTTMLRKLISEQKPEYLAVVMDPEGPTVRHAQYEAYKATRKPMPEDLVAQLPYINRVCEALRVPVLVLQRFEADDVIGTLALKAAAAGLSAIIVTSDKDMLQLVSDDIRVLDPMKDNLLIDSQKVIEKMGVRPDQIADLLGLWGDSSDNIPGAPGIGEKGARELIQTYGSVEACLNNWQEVRRKSYQQSLRDNADLIRTSRELATIQLDLPIELDLEALEHKEPDGRLAFELFSELGFRSLVQQFSRQAEAPETTALVFGDPVESHLPQLQQQPRIYVAMALAAAASGRAQAEAVCVMGDTGPALLLDLKRDSSRAQWGRIARNAGPRKCCWDAKTLLGSLEPDLRPSESTLEDVMLMAFLTAPHVGDYSLQRWALEQLQLPLPDPRGNDGSLLADAVPEGARQRLRAEADAVRRLQALLETQMEELGVRDVYREIEVPLIPTLLEMEVAGIRLRPERLQQLSQEMEGDLASLTRQVYEAAGTEFNINSPKQLGEILFEKLNLPTSKRTRKTKGFSTDQSVLEELAQSYELPRLVLEYRQISKLKSTYVDTLPRLADPDTRRVHTRFNQTGAATGRLSSSEPNLQNIPVRSDVGRRIREAFVPEEGNLLVSADYSQVELRVLAHLSGDQVLVDAFRMDQDIHERTALEVFGAADPANRSEWRRRAKVINFGIVYGLSAFGMAQRLGIPREESQAFIDAYFERYQGVRRWLDATVEEARRTGRVRTMFGRIRPIPDIHSKDYALRQFAERTAVNSPIQGTAADLIKIAMIRIRKSLRENRLSAKMLLQVHDELVLESPEREVEPVKELVRREMEGAAALSVRLRVDVSVADNWMDMK